jgi:aconitate hydratase
VFGLVGVADGLTPRGDVTVVAQSGDGSSRRFAVTVRIDTPEELVAFRHGGILPYVVRQLVAR